jgi:hypothetical protein
MSSGDEFHEFHTHVMRVQHAAAIRSLEQSAQAFERSTFNTFTRAEIAETLRRMTVELTKHMDPHQEDSQ